MRVRNTHTIRTTVATSLALATAVTPVFLFGTLSGPLREDLGFGDAGTGVAATLFFLAAAGAATPLGRATERIGASAAIRVGVTVSAAVCLGLGLAARTWWHVAALLTVGGAVVGLVDTGGARAFAERVAEHRRGLAFGIKEASVPAAAMLAGGSVPLLALRHGWQVTFAAGALLAPLVWLVLPPLPRVPAADGGPRLRGSAGRLVGVTVGVALAAGAATAGAAFLVPAATAVSTPAAVAGGVLAGASLVSVTVRIVVGWLADRVRRPPVRAMGLAMLLGAAGAVVLVDGRGWRLVIGAVLFLGAGWGWTGLAFLTAIRAVPEAPAAAAGVLLTGLALGGAGGPLVFQAAAATGSYAMAWVAAAACLAAGAGIVFLHGRRLGTPDGAR